MTMERQKGMVVFICDQCDGGLDTETAEFAKAREKMREEGWTLRGTDEGWEHICPDCNTGKK